MPNRRLFIKLRSNLAHNPTQTIAKPNLTEKERQRALLEQELVERQLQNAMVQAYAQTQTQDAQGRVSPHASNSEKKI